MLGRLRKTSRVDVGLALVFAGLAYLVWALVAGISRSVVQEMIKFTAYHDVELPSITRVVQMFFVDYGFVIDLVGLVWLVLSLLMIVQSSRQRISVSWAWVVAITQSFVAAMGAVLVGYVAYLPLVLSPEKVSQKPSVVHQLSQLSLPVIVPVAILIWTTFLVWLLVERARLSRHGPTLSDGMRSNVYK